MPNFHLWLFRLRARLGLLSKTEWILRNASLDVFTKVGIMSNYSIRPEYLKYLSDEEICLLLYFFYNVALLSKRFSRCREAAYCVHEMQSRQIQVWESHWYQKQFKKIKAQIKADVWDSNKYKHPCQSESPLSQAPS